MKVYTVEYVYPHSNRSNEIWITYQYKRDALNHKEHMEKDDLTLVGRLKLGSLIIHEKYTRVLQKRKELEEEITETFDDGFYDDVDDDFYDDFYDDYSLNGIFEGIFEGVDGEIKLYEPEKD